MGVRELKNASVSENISDSIFFFFFNLLVWEEFNLGFFLLE